MNQLQEALAGIRGGRIPPPGSMPSFEEVKEILGFNNYYDEEKRYSASITPLSSERCEYLVNSHDSYQCHYCLATSE